MSVVAENGGRQHFLNGCAVGYAAILCALWRPAAHGFPISPGKAPKGIKGEGTKGDASVSQNARHFSWWPAAQYDAAAGFPREMAS
jgi:hypothetical protein